MTRRFVACLACVVGLTTAASTSVGAQERFALIVSGASGGAPYAERYDTWRGALVTSLRGDLRFQDEHLFVLAETPGPGVGRASREGVRAAIDTLGERLGENATLLVVLIGHGTFDGSDAKFNLVGPDLDASEWRGLLDRLPGRLVFANTSSASFPFMAQLAGQDRIVITATDSPEQRYETRFPAFFVDAFKVERSDFDKDGRVSIWEAFSGASMEVVRWYEQQGRLSAERPVLDDTGDGVGKEAGAPGIDGTTARRLFLDRSEEAVRTTDPALAALLDRRLDLERAVDDLKVRRDQLTDAAYAAELERLLLELARVSREIRSRS
jgi:hypothetical protein